MKKARRGTAGLGEDALAGGVVHPHYNQRGWEVNMQRENSGEVRHGA